jgi:hypothetical protein
MGGEHIIYIINNLINLTKKKIFLYGHNSFQKGWDATIQDLYIRAKHQTCVDLKNSHA